MDYIETTLETLIKENLDWIKYLNEYPKSCSNLTDEELTFFKELKSYTDCKSKKSYNIIKKLIQSQGIRSIHPAWFIILKEYFEKDKFIFEEETIDDTDILDIIVPTNFKIPHRIQIIGTLKIYYTILTNPKIIATFIDDKSKFISSYTEFKEIYKFFFFPKIEKKVNNKFIDLSYEFNDIMKCIEVEINEPHHTEITDIVREQLIYFKTNNRIIQCYLSKDIKNNKKNEFVQINNCINKIIPKLVSDIFFRMTLSIYHENKFAGLTFNAFIKDIISNLTLAIFFSELKKESLSKNLTWKKFRKYCKSVRINIDHNFIKKLVDELPDDEIQRQKELEKRFYNYTELDDNALLTETGYDHYLMLLNKKQSIDSLCIKGMYSNYKQEYDKLMNDILTEKEEELDYLRTYTKSREYLLEMMKERLQ